MAGLYTNEQRFVWDVDALREIGKYPHPRNLLDASAILRRLLTDDRCLLHKVAKGRDFKPRFAVAVRDKMEPPEEVKKYGITKLAFLWTNPSLDIRDGMPTRELGLDAFLAEPVHQIDQTMITVKQLINYVANVGGGVHQGAPKNRDNAPTIDASAKVLIIQGKPYPLASIEHIAKITVTALYPLYLRVRA